MFRSEKNHSGFDVFVVRTPILVLRSHPEFFFDEFETIPVAEGFSHRAFVGETVGVIFFHEPLPFLHLDFLDVGVESIRDQFRKCVLRFGILIESRTLVFLVTEEIPFDPVESFEVLQDSFVHLRGLGETKNVRDVVSGNRVHSLTFFLRGETYLLCLPPLLLPLRPPVKWIRKVSISVTY